MSTTTFDAAAYKRTTELQWDEAAAAWHRWGPLLERWLGPATETMLRMARIEEGSRVLDVAAGTGGQTIAAARRVGSGGRVLATDISEGILRYAAAEAAHHGLTNVECRRADGEALDVAEGTFDAVISRLGLIYLPDRGRALAGMKRALRPGGRLAAIVYGAPERNQFFSTPVGIIRRRAGLGAPAPGQPGPFSLGSPGAIEHAFATAGFHDVETCVLDAPVRLSSAAECVRFERESFGALHQMMVAVDEAGRQAAWAEVAGALAEFERPEGFVGPCELIIAVGVA